MIYAVISLVLVLIIFAVVTFFMTYKNIEFSLEGGVLKVKNIGSHLKLYFNGNLIKDVFMPQLFSGEIVEFKIGEKELKLDCKCNTFGNKFSVKIYDGEDMIASNGVEIKK